MSRVLTKMYPKRRVEQKQRLDAAITECVASTAKCEDKFVSVTVEEIVPEDWAEEVYRPNILEKEGILTKKLGYNPFGQ